jgi:H/ACA ribonucleoprotein complex subunit 2
MVCQSLCIIAGDISPIDVITHVPILCEDSSVEYIYVNSKEALGTASSTKRPTSCILITLKKDSELLETYKELVNEVKAFKA